MKEAFHLCLANNKYTKTPRYIQSYHITTSFIQSIKTLLKIVRLCLSQENN